MIVAAFVAAVTGAAITVLSLGLIRVHPLLAVGLNVVAVGGLAPTMPVLVGARFVHLSAVNDHAAVSRFL